MTASNTALIELLTEELPPGFLKALPDKLTRLWSDALTEARLPLESPEQLTVWFTPRRIAVKVAGLPVMQPGQTVEQKGPPCRIAFDNDGNPTKAAEAFAKKCGVPVGQLEQTQLGKETFLTYTQQVEGRPTPEVLAELIPMIIDGLQGPRFMRWGDYDLRFPRPIHGLVALWGDELIPAKVHHLVSQQTTMGHRLFANHPIPIPSADDYEMSLLDDAHVMVDQAKRQQTVIDALNVKAAAVQGQWILNDDLLEEVVAITEKPWVFTGHIQDDYLALPKPVLVTVMASHQRYFAVEKANGDLLPTFLGVSDGQPQAEATIVAGNERVLRARFNDAKFFLDADMATPLVERVSDLSGITFQRGLGTLAEKSQRVEQLVATIAKDLNIPVTAELTQAAQLAKTDLTTQMVFEFTELEGLIGEEYARRQGLPDDVAKAISEQYLPRFQGDSLPVTDIGRVVSLADKVDTLVCVLSQPKVSMPTGSKDPMALRRLVNGVLLMLMTPETPSVDLEGWLKAAYQQVPLKEKADWTVVWDERCQPFIRQRLNSLLADKGWALYEQAAVIADGVAGLPPVWQRLTMLDEHLDVLRGLSAKTWEALLAPANRLQRFLSKNYTPITAVAEIKPDLFEGDDETKVFELVKAFWSARSSEWALLGKSEIENLASWAAPVDSLFENVMMNADDPALKANRYALLNAALTAYYRLGDLTQWQLDKDASNNQACVNQQAAMAV
jgi:glycyl-tRNA synthetase beta chain